jgi:hypothetical protein
MARKDAKGTKTQSLIRILLCVFAPFASLRETNLVALASPLCNRRNLWITWPAIQRFTDKLGVLAYLSEK